jgi:hypothetical protein
MARKKNTEETPKEDIISAEEAIQEEIKEAREKEAEEFLGEPIKEEEESKEEKPKEEEEKPKVKEEKEESEVDLTKIKEEIKGEVTQETTDKILTALTGEKEKKSEKEDELLSPWAKENRNPHDYEEVADWAVKKNEILARRNKEEQEIKAKQQQEINKRLETERQKVFNQHIDEQLNDLYENNRLPKIVNKDDPKDEGVIARKALFRTMLDVNKERVKEGKNPIYSIKEIYYEHYKAPKKEVAGADAPVFSGSGKFTPNTDKDDIDYREIHSARDVEDFF